MVHFLQNFSFYDILLVGVGLIIATLIRFYYDSHHVQKKLEELNNKIRIYNYSIDAYDDGLLILTQKNDIVFVNKEFADFFGVKEEDITKNFLEDIQLTFINKAAKEVNFLDAIDRRKYISDVRLSKMRHDVPVKISSNLFRNDDDPNTFWRVVVMSDLSDYYHSLKQIQKNRMYNDLLTDLPIVSRLMGDLVDANIRSNVDGTPVTLTFFGIKHFGTQRALFGYEKTNHLIRDIADSLRNNLQEGEKLYYRGRGDFALLMTEGKTREFNENRAQDFLHLIQSDFQEKGVEIDFSQAVLHLLYDKRAPDTIIDRCLKMQLESERLNRPIIEDFDKEDREVSGTVPLKKSAKKFTKTDFSNAIQLKEFFSFYQPIFDLKTDRLIGAEYLMRWNHPRYGLLNASDFLDKAVKLNFLTEITDYLLENVLSHKSSWDNLGITDFDLSINFAMPELRVANFAEKLEKKIRKHDINPETIIIDLSEKLLVEDIRVLREEMEVLKKAGVQIAMDSFGEGFTHLRSLEELPFDTIKIDQSLIRGIETNPDRKKLVAAIIAMGKNLNVTVGATYIDNKETHTTLKELGCDYGQGYYYSKALPFFEMLNFIQNHRRGEIAYPEKAWA